MNFVVIFFCIISSISLYGLSPLKPFESEPGNGGNPSIKELDLSNYSEWIGTFNGICPEYNMKNKYGEELIIFGSPVPVPSVSYTYEIYSNNTCSVYAKSSDGSYSCHNVEYSVSSNNNNFVLTMKPEAGSDCGGNEIILFKKDDEFSIMSGSVGQPEFKVEKNNY